MKNHEVVWMGCALARDVHCSILLRFVYLFVLARLPSDSLRSFVWAFTLCAHSVSMQVCGPEQGIKPNIHAWIFPRDCEERIEKPALWECSMQLKQPRTRNFDDGVAKHAPCWWWLKSLQCELTASAHAWRHAIWLPCCCVSRSACTLWFRCPINLCRLQASRQGHCLHQETLEAWTTDHSMSQRWTMSTCSRMPRHRYFLCWCVLVWWRDQRTKHFP